MRKILVAFAVCMLTSVVAFGQGKPFPNPENLAQEVANLTVDKVQPVLVQWESFQDGHAWYNVRVFGDSGEIYQVNFRAYRNGLNNLGIDLYLTTRDFLGKTANDVVADELVWGRAKIHQELHMQDNSVKGILDMYQKFYKRCCGGVWNGFTREERDLGEKAGVKQYLYMNEKVWTKRKFRRDGWVMASLCDWAQIKLVYEEHLASVKELLSK